MRAKVILRLSGVLLTGIGFVAGLLIERHFPGLFSSVLQLLSSLT